MNYLVIVPKCGHLVAWGSNQDLGKWPSGLNVGVAVSISGGGNQCGSCNGHGNLNGSCKQRMAWGER